MIIHCAEMDELIIPLNWEPQPFDLKKINEISRNHPYQKIMSFIYIIDNNYNLKHFLYNDVKKLN